MYVSCIIPFKTFTCSITIEITVCCDRSLPDCSSLSFVSKGCVVRQTYSCVTHLLKMAKKSNSNDKNKICRICLKDEKFTISIFCDYAKELNIHSRIETYLQIKIDRSDSLPKYICYDCFSNLEFVENFINKAKNSQTTFGTKEESGDSLFDDTSFHTPPNLTTKSVAKTVMKNKLDDSEFRSMTKKIRSEHKLQEDLFTRDCKRFKNSPLDFKNNVTIPNKPTGEKIVEKNDTKISPKLDDIDFQNRKTLLTDYYKQKCSLIRNNN